MIKVDLGGLNDVQNSLNSLEKALDTTAILDEAGALLFARTRQRFLKQVEPDGTPWVESYGAKHRRAIGRGGGTLYDTGHLFRSIQLYTVGGNTRAIGTNVPYAIDHQYGIGLVRRKFLGFSDEDLSLVTKLIVARIDREFAK